MNERDKELAEQATEIVDIVGPHGYASSYAKFDREKFADLIRADEREACVKAAKEHAAEYKAGGRLYPMLGRDISMSAEVACDHIAHLIYKRGQA